MDKILIIHNKYRLTGGEDIAVSNEINILKKHFDVKVIYFDNRIKNYIVQPFYFLINKNYKSIKIIKEEIKNFNPDIVYVHNTWFKVSPVIFSEIIKIKKPIILKIHNFRFYCTKHFFASRHFGKKTFCQGCGFYSKDMGIFNKYFSNSFTRSLLVVIYGIKFFKVLKSSKLKILTLTNFQRKFLIKNGINKENIFVHRNMLDNQVNFLQSSTSDKKYIVYAGRISMEKGVEQLINAFLKSNLNHLFEFKIIGDGPELIKLRENFSHGNIKFLGQISNEQTIKLIQKAKAVVTATQLYEGQPTLLCEASVMGVPSIFPTNEGISEFFPENYELTFDRNDQESIISVLNKIEIINLKEIGLKNKNFIDELINEESYIGNFKKIIHE